MASPSAYSNSAGVGPVGSSKPIPSPRRVAAPTRLGLIEEDGGMQPDIPQEPTNRQIARLFSFQGRASPPYGTYDNVRGPKGEKFTDLRNNRHVAKRGGWTRVLLIALIVLLVIAGLGVGLGVGLTRSKKSMSSTPSSPPPQASAAPFPAGSYTFDTVLSTVSTDCTPNPNTWRCYPYTTYSESSSGADAAFNWIITPTTEGGTDYLISSTNDPFALDFTNATLSMTNQGRSSEAYKFSINMQKSVIPNVTLTADGSATDCFYSGTMFSAVLYTKRKKTYPAQTAMSPSSPGAYPPWPYAVEVQQVASGGARVPDCYKMVNGDTGEHVPIGTVSDSQTCQCIYQNYGT